MRPLPTRAALVLAALAPAAARGTLIKPPESLEALLRGTDAVAHGTYNGSRDSGLALEVPGFGRVPLTAHHLSLVSVAGIERHEIRNKMNYRFLTPGGRRGNEVVTVGTPPSFAPGEEVVVLLRRRRGEFHVNKFTLGKFTVDRRAGGDAVLVNAAFPGSPVFSNVPFDRFLRLARERFGADGVYVVENRFIHKGGSRGSGRAAATPETARTGAERSRALRRRRAGRSVASTGPADMAPDGRRGLDLTWPVVALVIIGLYSRGRLPWRRP